MNRAMAWVDASDWVLAHFTRPEAVAVNRPALFVAVLTLLIGAIDYASGIRVSLAVFYLVPVLLATAWFGRRAGVAVGLTSIMLRVVGDYLSNDDVALPFWSIWNSMSALMMFMFIVWVFSNLLALYRRLEQRVVERTEALVVASEQRRQLEHQLLVIGLRERNAMGQELHDDICQHLVGTALAAKVLAQRLSQHADPLVREAESIVALVESGIAKTRRLARGLLLSSIDPEDLSEQLNELAEEVSRSGVPCRFIEAGDIRLDDPAVAAQIYRIAQEALRNAQRHAGARRIDVSLVADDKALCLMVEDDGTGLPADRASNGLGLDIMSDRAAYIGATLSLVPTAAHGGTRVICHLPLAPVAG